MKVHIDLPLLKINDMDYDDQTLRSEGYRLEMWKGDLNKIAEQIDVGAELFFQDETTINKDLLEQSELDPENTTYKLAEILFSNVQKATALMKHLKIRFDEIVAETETAYGEPDTYDVDGTLYDIYYDKELLAFGREISENLMRDESMGEVVGDIEYLDDYFDVIDINGLSEYLRGEIKDRDQENDISEKDFKDDKKVISWFAEEDEEYFLDMLEGYFDYGKMAEQMVDNVESAAARVNGIDGDQIFSEDITLDGYDTETVHIFERY